MNTELKAGALVAIGGLAQAVVYGLLAFAPLGQAGMAYGIYAGLASALAGGAIGWALGRAPVQFGGPRSSTALIVAGSLHGFMQTTQHTPQLLVLVALEVTLAGLLVGLAQRQGLGKLMQYLPAPVLIGLNTTLGVFSAYKLLPAMVGFAVYTSVWHMPQQLASFSATAIVLSFATVLALVYCRVIRPSPYGLLAGLLVGMGTHLAILLVWPAPGPAVLGTQANMPWGILLVAPPAALFSSLFELLHQHPTLLVQLLAGAAVIALLITLESMQSMLQVDQTLNTRHNTKRELNTLALANMVCGLLVALPSANYFSRSNAGLGMGSKSRQSEGWYTLCLAALLLLAWPWLALAPLPLLATLVAVSSLFLIQGSTLRLIAHSLWPRTRKHLSDTERYTVVVVAGMLVVTALSNLLLGTLVGVLFAAAYFLRQQSDTGLHSIETQPSARSRTMRPRMQRAIIDSAFDNLHWVRFEGNLFFGNSPAVCIRLQDDLTTAKLALLDYSKLRYIDDTATGGLQRTLRMAQQRHLVCMAVLPQHNGQSQTGLNQLEAMLTTLGVACHHHIDDAFHALENHALMQHNMPAPEGQHQQHPCKAANALQLSHLCDQLTPQQFEHLSPLWCPLDLRTGQVLFREGDAPCGLYVLHTGQLSAWQQLGHSSERLMRFCPGSLIGEMALVDQKPRSATLVAEQTSTVLHLPWAQWQNLQQQHPDIAHILLGNLAKELALRIRLANQHIALLQ
ncbi:MAG TPA: cyclic nucleotide-binding domain-containing protein [Limnobacter sp.]|nr:cyclic nucleotide-binding domain-containing protein [Limnobacter sp.]